MKISISELRPQEAIQDLEPVVAGAIVGGSTGVTIFADSFAEGDFTIAKTDTNAYSFSFETDVAEYSFSLGLGYALSFSANAKA